MRANIHYDRVRIWLDGQVLSAVGVEGVAPVNYGHFTVMQVRSGAVRGIALHLARIDQAHRELFGHGLDLDAVRKHWRAATQDYPQASLRAIYHDMPEGHSHELLVVSPPAESAAMAQRLLPVHYMRPFPHLKHVGTFAQIAYHRQAVQAGYDGALLVNDAGEIAETAIANIGFIRDHGVAWPVLPSLHGTGQQLLEKALTAAGIHNDRTVVRLSDLPTYEAAFAVNSTGIVPVSLIGERHFIGVETRVCFIQAVWKSLPWEAI